MAETEHLPTAAARLHVSPSVISRTIRLVEDALGEELFVRSARRVVLNLRGKVTTDAEGRYEITTILPGFYLNGASYRPRHVHYKVSYLDDVALTTQLYFEGDPNIPTDAFVKPSLVMPLSEESDGAGGTLLRCVFDIVLA